MIEQLHEHYPDLASRSTTSLDRTRQGIFERLNQLHKDHLSHDLPLFQTSLKQSQVEVWRTPQNFNLAAFLHDIEMGNDTLTH